MKTTTAVEGAETKTSARFGGVRRRSLELCAGLSAEDMMVQSCPEASPAKWHLAHTAWFFESFVLREYLPGYRLFNEDFPWLFNSYYEGFSAFPEKRLRASFSRPGLDEILRYREHVDLGIERLLDAGTEDEALRRIELGANHEEQHQELLLTDILHAFYTNPLRPTYKSGDGIESQLAKARAGAHGKSVSRSKNPDPSFVGFEGGLKEAGHKGGSFCFDNELPRHRVWLEPFCIATRLVTCGEFAEFMADGGYSRPELWLSAGWDAVKRNGWRAPLYWASEGDEWNVFTLRGQFPLQDLDSAPVSHVSFYEADAYARWAGKRLPTEFEWEVATEGKPIEGNLLDAGLLVPSPANLLHQNNGTRNGARNGSGSDSRENSGEQWWGDCWEWTSSAYLGYPGFRPLEGALGEYNGKFMSGQMVLRGGSCVTPIEHIRASYRNFFSPETRWQFSGIRLTSL